MQYIPINHDRNRNRNLNSNPGPNLEPNVLKL